MAEIIINDSNYMQFLTPIEHNAQGTHGLKPRNYLSHPLGYSPYAKPFDLPLIPESEWEDRLKARIAAKANFSDIRNIGMAGSPMPSRDQNGKGYSHDADTECLTVNGWIPWSGYNGTDLLASVNPITGMMEFQAPTERHAYEYKDEMFHSTNRRLDFGVTRNHRMLVRRWDDNKKTLSDEYTFQRADEI